MEQGLLIKDFAKQMGVTEDTVINWEIRGMMPRYKSSIQRISEMVPQAGKWLNL
jgi:DNA-binding transcriptional regulator YiaG